MTDNTNSNSPRLHWDNLSDNDCIKYGYTTDNLLQYVNLPDAVYCKNVNCMNHDHVESTKIFHENIVDCLKQAGVVAFPQSNSNKFNIKHGWLEHVADLYNTSRETYYMWCDAGKPRQGPIHELCKRTKARCKYAIRFIKSP